MSRSERRFGYGRSHFGKYLDQNILKRAYLVDLKQRYFLFPLHLLLRHVSGEINSSFANETFPSSRSNHIVTHFFFFFLSFLLTNYKPITMFQTNICPGSLFRQSLSTSPVDFNVLLYNCFLFFIKSVLMCRYS